MFKIGEFARIADVSVHLLRHYNDIELFVPANIDKQSGYRYYTIDQLPRLHRVIALRELGFALEQIATMLDENISDCEIQGMLRLKKQQVEQIIETEHSRLRRIETRLAQLENTHDNFDVVLKEVPELHIVSTGRQQLQDQQIIEIFIESYHILKAHDLLQEDYGLVLPHDGQSDDGYHNIEIGYILKKPISEPIQLEVGWQLTSRTIPAVDMMATIVHHGPRQNHSKIYQHLLEWVSANDYQYRDGHMPREIYHQPVHDADDPNNIVEIQIPVIKQ